MNRPRRTRPLLLLLILATTVLAAVGPAAPQPAIARGGAAPSQTTGALPADFPAGVPLPPGSLQDSKGSAGTWTVLLLARGSAAYVQKSTLAFYTSRGYKGETDSIVHNGSYRITFLAENRDHSNTETNLVLGVVASHSSQTPPPSAGLLASILRQPAQVTLARARRDGLRLAFKAPGGARTARVRAYRTDNGRRRLFRSKTVPVHAGRNTVALKSTARHPIKPGTYALSVILRAADGTSGPPASTSVRVLP